MTWMRGLLERVRETLDRKGFERELDDEIRFHIEREVERLRAAGMDAESARRRALLEFGEVERVKEDAREDAGFPLLENVLRDVRHAVRGLRRSPGFALAAVLTLGLGIGATTAIFSVVDGILLEPLPYAEPERLVRLVEQNRPDNRFNLSMADFLAVRDLAKSFESVSALETGTAAMTGRGAPEEISIARVSSDWFRVLRVEPAEGRGFRAGEDDPGAPRTVVLSSALRDRVFGAGAHALGASLTLDGQVHTVVGVLGPDQAVLAGRRADAWPILPLETPRRRGPFLLAGVARLAPDRTVEDARAELDGISREIFTHWFATGFRDEQARITPYAMKELMLGDVASGLWLMLGAVAGVLLIAVSNVGNLFLVRAVGREREIALRASLGASRRRIAGQLIVESLVVAALGGLLGLAVAWLGLRTLLARTTGLPRMTDVHLDGSVLLVTAGVTLGAAVLFGLAPLARVLGARIGPGARADTGARGGSALRATLVAAEFAIAFTLATGAGLLLDSFLRLRGVNPGYDPEAVVAMRLSLPPDRYADYEEMQAFWSEALRRARETPGVAAVGLAAALPPANSAGTNNFDLLGSPTPDGQSEPSTLWNYASPELMATLGVPLLRGRLFDDRDRTAEQATVVVSQSWAQRFFPDREVLGAQLYAGGDRSTAMTIVGVVGDVKYLGLDATDDAVVYEPHWQANLRTGHLVMRARGPIGAAVEGVRSQIAALDPELPISAVETMAERANASLARPRNWTTLLGLFAGLGLVLACVGVYGVLSHWVGAQRRQIAIRLSLGAEPSSVSRLVLARGLSLAGVGMVVGLGASLLLARSIRALLFGVSPQDPANLATVAAALAAVALIACALPARAAARVDPMVTLRSD